MDLSIRLGERDLELGEALGQDPDGEWAGTQQLFRSDMTDKIDKTAIARLLSG